MNGKQQKLLNRINELTTYGFTKISENPINPEKIGLKKHVLYLMMAATQSYTESIIKLITPPSIYYNASEVLFRSLIENFINLSHIYTKRNYKNVILFISTSILDKNSFANSYKDLMQNYPQWNLDFGNIRTREDWDAFINKNKRDLDKIGKKYNIQIPQNTNQLPNIKTRAEECDQMLANKNILTEGSSLVKYYVLYYKYFSQITHLTTDGLNRFFDKVTNTIHIDDTEENMERMLAITYHIYLAFLVFTLKKFSIYKYSEMKTFIKFSKEINVK